jgi:hypothetical protein
MRAKYLTAKSAAVREGSIIQRFIITAEKETG